MRCKRVGKGLIVTPGICVVLNAPIVTRLSRNLPLSAHTFMYLYDVHQERVVSSLSGFDYIFLDFDATFSLSCFVLFCAVSCARRSIVVMTVQKPRSVL